MKQNYFKIIPAILTIAFLASSCTSINKSMKEPANHIEFTKADFTLSEQLSAEASATRILGIDLARLFKMETGTVEGTLSPATVIYMVPVVGTMAKGSTANYALYTLMTQNAGYDMVLYPQFESKKVCPLGIPIISKETVKVTARLAKFK